MTEAPGVTNPALRLARIALGCGNFGGVGSAPEFFGQGLSQDQALAVMDAAWQVGITHFDTADAYGGGRSEASIGHWIATRGVRPQLTTKTYNPMAAGADRGLAPGRIARQLRASLDRLGVGHVELYLAHDFDPDVPLAETFGAFEQARAQGVQNLAVAFQTLYGTLSDDQKKTADAMFRHYEDRPGPHKPASK